MIAPSKKESKSKHQLSLDSLPKTTERLLLLFQMFLSFISILKQPAFLSMAKVKIQFP